MKDVNEMIVQASNDLAKFAEIDSERVKMVKCKGFQGLNEKMKTMNHDGNEIYQFLEVKQADGIKMKELYNRVKEKSSRGMKIITRTELNDKNLVKVIPVAAYPMNVCKLN